MAWPEPYDSGGPRVCRPGGLGVGKRPTVKLCRVRFGHTCAGSLCTVVGSSGSASVKGDACRPMRNSRITRILIVAVGMLCVWAIAAGWRVTEKPEARLVWTVRSNGHIGRFAEIQGSTGKGVAQQSSRLSKLILELPSASVVI